MAKSKVEILNEGLGRLAALEPQLHALAKALAGRDATLAVSVADELGRIRNGLTAELLPGFDHSMQAFHAAIGGGRPRSEPVPPGEGVKEVAGASYLALTDDRGGSRLRACLTFPISSPVELHFALWRRRRVEHVADRRVAAAGGFGGVEPILIGLDSRRLDVKRAIDRHPEWLGSFLFA